MKALRRLYFRLFRRYRRIEFRYVSWGVAHKLFQANPFQPATAQWHLAPEEDYNIVPGLVAIERRERIVE